MSLDEFPGKLRIQSKRYNSAKSKFNSNEVPDNTRITTLYPNTDSYAPLPRIPPFDSLLYLNVYIHIYPVHA